MLQKPISGDSACEGMKFRSVFHSFQSVCSILRNEQFGSKPEIQQLFAVAKNYGLDSAPRHSAQRRAHPLIVLEGLDASGKTLVSKKLAEVLNAERRTTPPNCLLPLRKNFDETSVHLRRAYYALGNYIAAKEVEELLQQKMVIMDRFWHSTTAYAIATEIHNDGKGIDFLPQRADSIYEWPSDLLKPDLVLFLIVDETTRLHRQKIRNLGETSEEKQLKDAANFRNLILETYRRMENPSLVEIDTSSSIEEEVMSHCLAHIRQLNKG